MSTPLTPFERHEAFSLTQALRQERMQIEAYRRLIPLIEVRLDRLSRACLPVREALRRAAAAIREAFDEWVYRLPGSVQAQLEPSEAYFFTVTESGGVGDIRIMPSPALELLSVGQAPLCFPDEAVSDDELRALLVELKTRGSAWQFLTDC